MLRSIEREAGVMKRGSGGSGDGKPGLFVSALSVGVCITKLLGVCSTALPASPRASDDDDAGPAEDQQRA
jgi:hypothetical protein